jgi:hypothetical protein
VQVIDVLQCTYRTYSTIKFWVISALISALSVVLLPNIFRDLQASLKPGDTLLGACLLIIAIFGVSVLPFAIWQHVQLASFFRWLRENQTGRVLKRE